MGTSINIYCPYCNNLVKKNGANRGKQRYYCTKCKKSVHPVRKKLEDDNLLLFCNCGRQAKKYGENRGKQRYYCTNCNKSVSYIPSSQLIKEREILTFWVKNGRSYSATIKEYNTTLYRLKRIIEESKVELEKIENSVKIETEKRNEEIYNYWVNRGSWNEFTATKFGISVKDLRRIIAKKLNAPENWNVLRKLRARLEWEEKEK